MPGTRRSSSARRTADSERVLPSSRPTAFAAAVAAFRLSDGRMSETGGSGGSWEVSPARSGAAAGVGAVLPAVRIVSAAFANRSSGLGSPAAAADAGDSAAGRAWTYAVSGGVPDAVAPEAPPSAGAGPDGFGEPP